MLHGDARPPRRNNLKSPPCQHGNNFNVAASSTLEHFDISTFQNFNLFHISASQHSNIHFIILIFQHFNISTCRHFQRFNMSTCESQWGFTTVCALYNNGATIFHSFITDASHCWCKLLHLFKIAELQEVQ